MSAMQFAVAGAEYRIGFRHGLSRRWEDHYGAKHEVRLIRQHCKDGPAILVCITCSDKVGQPFKLSHLSRSERIRQTACTLYTRDTASEWKVVYTGVARLNVEAGDRFSFEAGRRAALSNLLSKVESRSFRAAARIAYEARRPSAAVNSNAASALETP